MAFHELLIKENKKISNYSEVRKAMDNLSKRIETGQSATSTDERRKNIDQVKGLLSPSFVVNDKSPRIFSGNSVSEIDSSIRRSEIELANYELKQGILELSKDRKLDKNILDKIINTIAAISNNGHGSSGKIIIGVTDKQTDADLIEKLDNIKSINVGNKSVVGINREAKILQIRLEGYVSIIKQKIKLSELTETIKMNVLSRMDFNNYYGLGIIIIEIPSPKEMAFVGDNVYWRNFDSTELTTDAKKIAAIAKRF